MRDEQGRYQDPAVANDGGLFAVAWPDGRDDVYDSADAMERAIRAYRIAHGRRGDDGGPLEWPQIQRTFKAEPWKGE